MKKVPPKSDIVPRIALVAMPWYSVWVPSVQLSVLRRCLEGVGNVDSYELYVDYAAVISTQLYDRLAGGNEFVEEWLFAQHFFRGQGIDYPEDIDHFGFPPMGMDDPGKEREVLAILSQVTGEFLERMAADIDWQRYDVIGFTLGIAQTGASMALAALIKKRHPNVRIVFGGSACEGEQAHAILSMCPHVDVIVRGEAEGVVGPLVQRLVRGRAFDDLAELTWRGPDGKMIETGDSTLRVDFPAYPSAPQFDEYLARMERLGLRNDNLIMLPFESSRGCWWGQKSQCTFCGLAQDMRYRKRDADEVLAEIDSLYKRYGISRFFATDLIMPKEYHKDFLPRIRESGRPYWFYYELKANVSRSQVAGMSGLVHVQPGLESLSTPVLRTMKKGISAAQNVQFLKWCTEYDVKIFTWHLILGMPGESPDDLDRMTASVPGLHHLQPPNLAFFELHRFSPIHRNPAEFGLRDLRPVPAYSKIFPIEPELLNKLVYRFEYQSRTHGGQLPPWMREDAAETYAQALQEAVIEWKAAWARGASFSIEQDLQGGWKLTDSRFGAEPKEGYLSPEEHALYQFLDSSKNIKSVAARFRQAQPAAYERLDGTSGVECLIQHWLKRCWLLEDEDRIVALAVYSPAQDVSKRRSMLVPAIEGRVLMEGDARTQNSSN